MKNVLAIRPGLKVANVHAYTHEDKQKKNLFHRDAKAFLKSLAEALELSPNSFEIRSNKAGIGTSGEVILLAKHLHVELYENSTRRGITMVYRSRESMEDFAGGRNNFLFPEKLENDLEAQSRFIDECRRLMAEGIVNARRRAVA
jgi:hypothetical protein